MLVVPGADPQEPFAAPAVAAVPADWMAALPGRLIAAAHAVLLRGAAAGCVLLGVAAVVLPFVLQAQAQDGLDRRIAALQNRVAAVQAIEHRISGSSAGADLVENERRRMSAPDVS